MRAFLRENWLWIALPFLLVAGGLALLLAGSYSEGAEFVYPGF